VMRYERWVQHNLIRDEGRLPALRELTQSASVEKTAALVGQLTEVFFSPLKLRPRAAEPISHGGDDD
jgi:hypothetical protein